jgi:hypothetical protein
MSGAISGTVQSTRMSRSLSSGAHSRDPLAHAGYGLMGRTAFAQRQLLLQRNREAAEVEVRDYAELLAA